MLAYNGRSAAVYARRHERSEQVYERARQVIPGGVTANIKYFPPHPIMMKRANGSKLFDVDGNDYIDYMLCYGALITGHGHQRIYEAITRHMHTIGTTIFGTPHELETEMAEALVSLYPGVDMVRFTNSGLEATLLAVRLAAAFTGKRKLAKFEGHYHGGYNQVLLSVHPHLDLAGESRQPRTVPESSGIADDEIDRTIILPFNNLVATEKLLREQANDIAAVIVEPVQGGFIPADKAFIQGLRELTKKLNIVLIFDEVKTGFRVSVGGAQALYDVQPDLTALGKVLGGGFPIGAVGGREELMMLTDPRGGRDVLAAGGELAREADVLFHSGTYNGHPVSLAAGLETIHLLQEEGVIERLNANVRLLRNLLEDVYHSRGIPMQTMGMGSIFNIVLTDRVVSNYRDLQNADHALRKAIDYELLNAGIYIKPSNRYSLSVAHSEEDIYRTAEAHERAIKQVV